MPRQPKRRPEAKVEAAPLDPVALSIAIWLGLAVCVAGFNRLIQSAALSNDPAAPTALIN